MWAKAKGDICEDIKKGDRVEIVSDYMYMFGSDQRIKEYFNVKTGEVVVKKKLSVRGNREEYTIIKCKRDDLDIQK